MTKPRKMNGTSVKVAVIHSFYSAETPSGENVMVEAQVKALTAAGFTVELISVRSDELAKSRLYPVRAAINVATGTGISPLNKLREFVPDIVHVHNLFPNFSTAWLKEWDGPVVATLHNFRSACAAGTLYRNGGQCFLCPDMGSHHGVIHRCYRGSALASLPLSIRNRGGIGNDALLSRADRVVVLSKRSSEIYERLGLASSQMQIVENFVDSNDFAPHVAPGNDWVYLGRLTEEKGILRLLEHWPVGRRLSLYGDGPLRSAVEASMNPDIRYKGSVARAQIPAVLEEARGLVFPSIWAEGATPLTYIESLAAARPVVALSGNAAADDVKFSGSGEVFQTWEGLEDSLEKVDKDIDVYAARARERYVEEFGVQRWVQKISDVYSSLL